MPDAPAPDEAAALRAASARLRSMAGAQAFCAIRSYLSTAAKHGISMLDALTRAASGTARIPETP